MLCRRAPAALPRVLPGMRCQRGFAGVRGRLGYICRPLCGHVGLFQTACPGSVHARLDCLTRVCL